jgi:hypothetical protein
MFDIICQDLDHESRSEEFGWTAVIGQSDKENAQGYLCEACAIAKRIRDQE